MLSIIVLDLNTMNSYVVKLLSRAILFLCIANGALMAVNGFKASITRGETKCMEKHVNNCSVIYTKLDNGSYLLSVYSNLLQDVEGDVTAHLRGTEKKKGEIFRIDKPLCQFISSDSFFVKIFRSHSNLPNKCPIPAGPLYVQDHVVGAAVKGASAPPGFMAGMWTFVFTIKQKEEEVYRVEVDLKLE